MHRTAIAAVCLVALARVTAADPAPLPTPDDALKSYAAHIAAAEYALRLNEPGALLRWLDAVPQAHRGFEWRALRAQADASERVIGRAEGTIMFLAATRDGSTVACASADKCVRLFRAADGALICKLEGHESEVYGVAFSPDGKEVASCSRDGTLRIWTVAEAKERAKVKVMVNVVTSVAWSPDGATIATTTYGQTRERGVWGELKFWEPAELKELARMEQGVKPLTCCDFSADSKQLVVGDWDDGATLWDVQKREPITRIKDCGKQLDGVDLSADGKWIVAACRDNRARVFAADGTPKATLEGHTDTLISARFSPDGARIVTTSVDGTLRLWTPDGACTAVLRGQARAARQVIWLPDGRMISGGIDRDIKLWPADITGVDPVTETFKPTVYATEFSPDGRLFAVTGGNEISLRDAATGAELARIKAGAQQNMTATFDAAGARILACNCDGIARVFSAYTGALISELKGHTNKVVGGTFLPENHIVTCAYDGTARIWNAATGESIKELKGHKAVVNWCAASAAGTIATASGDGTIRLWSAQGDEVGTLTGHRGAVHTVAFSPDGTRLASAGDDSSVRLWDVAEKKESALLRGHDSQVYRVAFSHDGTRIASGSTVLKLWHAVTGECLLTRKPLADTIWCLAFAPGDKTLAVGSWNGTYSLWHATSVAERNAKRAALAGAGAEAASWVNEYAGEKPDWEALVKRAAGTAPALRTAILNEILKRATQ